MWQWPHEGECNIESKNREALWPLVNPYLLYFHRQFGNFVERWNVSLVVGKHTQMCLCGRKEDSIELSFFWKTSGEVVRIPKLMTLSTSLFRLWARRTRTFTFTCKCYGFCWVPFVSYVSLSRCQIADISMFTPPMKSIYTTYTGDGFSHFRIQCAPVVMFALDNNCNHISDYNEEWLWNMMNGKDEMCIW